ncbi:MAG: SGNH/GDSL hydrolase family protein [Duncaniella sp.]|nr:SGNH/GDSL hydrolase family protein [Duncaniella sp.]
MKTYRTILSALLITLTSLISLPQTLAETPQKKNKVVLFIGDSITDGGWGRSAGYPKSSAERNKKDLNHLLGHSYVLFCSGRVLADNPEADMTWLNRGISGNTVGDLENRWEEDVIALQPDLLSVLVGINDVLTHDKKYPGEPFDIKDWKKRYRVLLDRARQANPDLTLVLISPFVGPQPKVSSEETSARQAVVDGCAAAVKELAGETDAIYIDGNGLFHSLTDNNPQSARWLWDGVHPTPAGHQRLADLWLEKVDITSRL